MDMLDLGQDRTLMLLPLLLSQSHKQQMTGLAAQPRPAQNHVHLNHRADRNLIQPNICSDQQELLELQHVLEFGILFYVIFSTIVRIVCDLYKPVVSGVGNWTVWHLIPSQWQILYNYHWMDSHCTVDQSVATP